MTAVTKSFTHYTVKNGLPDNTIYGILADADGNLWLSTNKGLSKFDPGAGILSGITISATACRGTNSILGRISKVKMGKCFLEAQRALTHFFPGR